MFGIHIDSHGQRHNRRAVSIIQKRHGRDIRVSAAEAKRNRRKAKRASATAVLFYPWPVDGVECNEPVGAYAHGPNCDGKYQVVVVGEPKGTPDLYAAAMSKWIGKPLSVLSFAPMDPPDLMDDARAAAFARGFLSIILALA